MKSVQNKVFSARILDTQTHKCKEISERFGAPRCVPGGSTDMGKRLLS